MRGSFLVAAALALTLCATGVPAASPAAAEEAPTVPQQVEAYFAQDLIPRLRDLYGPGADGRQGIDFDDTAEVGTIQRVYEWTPEFLAGRATPSPARATNDWVAPVSARKSVLGLATVWINPETDLPELARFDSAAVAARIVAAPEGTVLVRDLAQRAWFALGEDSLMPLVDGSSGVTSETTPEAYQRLISPGQPGGQPDGQQRGEPGGEQGGEASVQAGVEQPTMPVLVLAALILLLVIFVLLPTRSQRRARKSGEGELNERAPDAEAPGEGEPGEPEDAEAGGAEAEEPDFAGESGTR